ncbi:MAG: hypothetical protein OER21_11065 [Gemmatimonadota bacterium]|nr:hypothetical protein [Gemmatimonadota bacterium]
MSTTTRRKTVFIPRMCDHALTVGAAMRAQGTRAEVLPPPDDETLGIGLNLCAGRECSPCFTCTGDIIRRARQPGFDPATSVLLMPTTAGPCRFGQYSTLLRNVLDEQGLGDMEIASPSGENSYRGFSDHPGKLRALMWEGVVAVDLLQKLLHEYRPYEGDAGSADRVYARHLDLVVEATEAGGEAHTVKSLRDAATAFAALPVDRSEPRPLIGLVGEIYLRFNTYSNQDVVRQVENAGGEVTVATLMEWLYFTNWQAKRLASSRGAHTEFLKVSLVDLYQQRAEHRLLNAVAHALRYPHEASVAQLMSNIRPYYEPMLGTEAVLSMGRAIEYARNGLSGILNIMPFSCMPGIIVAGMAPQIRADLDNVPWLDVIYAAQGGTNIQTRLEAFMHQAHQFQRRRSAQASRNSHDRPAEHSLSPLT